MTNELSGGGTEAQFWHPVHAPKGKLFPIDDRSLPPCADQGWVDHPAKLGVNDQPQGRDDDPGIVKIHHEYLSGEIPGISPETGENDGHRCAIWNTVAAKEPAGDRYGFSFDSPRAGGRYFIPRRAELMMASCDERVKARLTTWLVDQRRLGSRHPEVSSNTIEDAERSPGLTIPQRVDRLLRYIGKQTPQIGAALSLANQKDYCAAMAWSESTSVEEVQFLLDYIKQRGWIRVDNSRENQYILTIDGHARLAELEVKNSDSSRAFIAMWFDPGMNEAWDNGIKPGIKDAGYTAIRIDETEFNNRIDDEIIAEIRRSRFLVADFTQGGDGARGGVYYEAGFAHGLGLPVIFTCHENMIDKVHFDTRQYNHIAWKTPEELRKRFAERIAATIGDGPNTEG